MSPYNPEIHHRRSIRLKGYDYASEGLYFVTICMQNRECLFGEIKNDEMILNDAGRMVEKWYLKTQDKFPDIVCHEMVIMPNHFHCIWENVGLHGASPVGALRSGIVATQLLRTHHPQRYVVTNHYALHRQQSRPMAT